MRRMSPKRIRLVGIAVTVLLATVAGALLCVPVVRIDQATCDRIQPGMTVGEAEAIVGGRFGWYDGVWGISTDAPPYRFYTWIGSPGEIILELNEQDRVAEAKFYPGRVRHRSVSKFVVERLTRNALGTGRTDLVIEASHGVLLGVLLTAPIVVIALLWRLHGGTGGAYALCLLGALASLALLIMVIGVRWGAENFPPFWLVGFGSSGLICFIVGSVLTGRRRVVTKGTTHEPTSDEQ